MLTSSYGNSFFTIVTIYLSLTFSHLNEPWYQVSEVESPIPRGDSILTNNNQLESNIYSDTTLANKYLNKAKKFIDDAQYDSSNFYFGKASLIYEKENMWDKYIECNNSTGNNLRLEGKFDVARLHLDKTLKEGLNELGHNHPIVAKTYHILGVINFSKGDLDNALEDYYKALAIWEQRPKKELLNISKIYNNIGIIHQIRGNLNKALEFHHKALSIKIKTQDKNQSAIAASYANIGLLYRDKGDLNSALGYFQKDLAITQEIYGRKSPEIAITYNNIGLVYYDKGDYTEALKYYQKALSIKLLTKGQHHPSVALSYTNFGNVHHAIGNYNKALEYHNKALSIQIKELDKNHPDIAASYLNIGNAYLAKGDYDKALEFQNKALLIQTEIFDKNHPDIATSYLNVGNVYLAKDNYDKALEYQNKALSIRLRIFDEKHPSIAETYHEIGNVYFSQNKFYTALNYYQKSIIAAVSDFRDININVNPILSNIIGEPELLTSLLLKANTLKKLYLTQTKNIRHLQLSLDTYGLASKLIDKMRYNYKAEQSKLFLGENVKVVYSNAIETALRLFELKKEDHYKEEAFSFAEKSKSRVLLEIMTDAGAKKFTGIPDSLLEKERNLRIDLTYYKNQLLLEKEKGIGADSARLNYLHDKLFTNEQEYYHLIETFELIYPKYYGMKYETQIRNVGDIQEYLDDRSALIEYFVGDSLLYIFTIANNHFDVITLPFNESILSQLVDAYLNSIKKIVRTEEYLETSFQLYNMLLKPIEKRIVEKEKLIFIPDSKLFSMPFEPLITQQVAASSNVDFTQLPYLLRQFSISYHYSASLFLGYGNTVTAAKVDGFAGFAPVFFKERNLIEKLVDMVMVVMRGDTILPDLPGTREEVFSIHELFKTKNQNSKTYLEDNAKEEYLKSESLKKYKYIHIATHGLINDNEPGLSSLILSQPQDPTYQDDGNLFSSEIYNLELNADLVVLSSCESGIGKLLKGEGMMAINRGFLYSGVNNIIYSLWRVRDKPTSQMMIAIYKHILDGKDYSEALKDAKLKMIQKRSYAIPFYWSGFVLMGN